MLFGLSYSDGSKNIKQFIKKEKKMKVLAINSSPRTGGESRSEKLLSLLVDGMKQEGADVEVINLREYNVKFCQGCYSCWTKTPGVCIHKDDMSRTLYPKWLESDIVIYSTPLYHRTFSAMLKAFIERTLPAALPYLESDGDRTNHPVRDRVPDFVMLSVAGFPELEEFQLLSDLVQYNFNTGRSRLLAEIYRTSSQPLTHKLYREIAEDVYNAVKTAGQEIIRDGKVADRTMARITQPIQKKSEMVKISNMQWQTCIDKKITPRQFDKSGDIPSQKTIEDMMLLMSLGVNGPEARKTDAKVQFLLSGQQSGAFYLDIQNGLINAVSGETDQADVIIKTPFELWRDIMEAKADGTQMLMEGKYQVEGDVDLFINLMAAR
jgi:multimeric flavodoxin WrbA/putative sterol carrier protein